MNEQNWNNGDFCWIDLMTTDTDKAQSFYSEIFGWTYDSQDTPQGPYIFTSITEGAVGGIGKISEEQQKQGMPAHWNTFVQVSDADAVATRTAQLGGKVIMPVMEMMGAGRMGVFSSPSGSTFSVWQSLSDGASKRTSGMKHGMFGWIELCTNNVDQDGQFYCNLFNWTPEITDMPTGEKYTTFKSEGAKYPVAGMMQNPDNNMPSAWSVYFTVDSMTDSTDKIKNHGGKVIMEPFDVPKVGKMAVFQDPTGAYFCTAQWDFSAMDSDC